MAEQTVKKGVLYMVVKLHDIRQIIENSLHEVEWDNLIGIKTEEISNSEFYIIYSEVQDLKDFPICESKYKITIEGESFVSPVRRSPPKENRPKGFYRNG